MKPIFSLLLAAAICVASGHSQETQGNRPKTAPPAAMTQPPDPMSLAQSEAGSSLEDQVVSYRFRLAPAEFGTDLLITNSGDRPGVVTLFARERAGHEDNGLKSTVAPGETLWLSSQDGLAVSDLLYVKASRRLRLSFRYAGEAERLAISLSPAAALYDVFSWERQSEMAFDDSARQVEFLAPGRRASRKLAGRSAARLVSELSAMADGAPSRGVFVAYKVK